MNTKSNLRKKAVSPLIATILLIVVAVILVTVLLTWGKFFTSSSLDSANQGLSLTRSDAELYIYPKSLTNGLLQFNYSPQSNFGEIVIESYKVLSDSGETPDTNLSSTYILKQGTNVISLTDFSSLGLEANKKVTIILQTTDNHYISVKNITNVFTEAPVDLPYVMLYGRKLYIQPSGSNQTNGTGTGDATFTWVNAMAYCEGLDAHGYSDWYLPSMTQLAAMWEACSAASKSNTCMNDAIGATHPDFVSLMSDYYWSSTEYGSDSAYFVGLTFGDVLGYESSLFFFTPYVRCVRDLTKTSETPEAPEVPSSSEKDIIYFTINDINGTIDTDYNTIAFELESGTDVTSLTPTITISEEATISPASGVAQDFTTPITYTVTAKDNSTKIYTVSITIGSESIVDANLPYVMFGDSKLYIQPSGSNEVDGTGDDEGPFTWVNAMAYCEGLDAHGYDDWYLPSRTQLAAIWEACSDQSKSNSCMNAAIGATHDNFVLLRSDLYWSSTESGSANAYLFSMNNGHIYYYNYYNHYYVRCVRDQ